MVTTIIIIASILILVILFVLLRIQTLISVMKGTYTRKVSPNNNVHGILFLVFLILGLIAFYWSYTTASDQFLPAPASIHGVRIDNMFWLTMGILTFAFIITNIFLFLFAYKYSYKEGNKAYFYPENHKLEIVWTVIPAIIMTILVFYGWKEWSAITAPQPENSEVVEVMGKQFAWQVRYPGPDGVLGSYDYRLIDETNTFGLDFTKKASLDDFAPAELHVPKGKPVVFSIRARDVLHSVFVPHFRLKMDAVPGSPTKFWFTPTKTTREMREELANPNFNYELACTEICGRGHFAMRYVVVVEEPEEYEAWKSKQQSIAALNAEYVNERVPAELKSLIPAAETAEGAEAPAEMDGAAATTEAATDTAATPADTATE